MQRCSARRTDHRDDTSVPRPSPTIRASCLWQSTFERIRERPWLGYGFGKSILRTELTDELRDPMLAHAHNLFVSQWLQTGAIGVLALCAMLLRSAGATRLPARRRRHAAPRSASPACRCSRCSSTKNLTDDFMMRPTSKEFWAMSRC
jgi:O-antigen ligase